MDYDFVVVGSGSVGAAAGYYAACAGLKVLMVDNGHPPHEEGSHHGQTRLIRHAYGEGARYVPLVLRAQSLWEDLQHRWGAEIFARTGVIYVASRDDAFLAEVQASGAEWDIPLEVLDRDAAADRWPQVTVPDGYALVHEPGAGLLRSEVAVTACVSLARDHGADQVFGQPVTAISSDEGGVTISTADQAFRAKKALISAGTWATHLLPDLPVTPVRKVFTWHETDGRYDLADGFPGFAAVMANGQMFYGFPAEDGVLKIGQHTGGQVISQPEERLPFGALDSDGSEVTDFLASVLPGVGPIRFGASCTYDNSPDEDFIIDTLPDQPNVMVISGLSGHGYKFAAALGEIASGFAQGKPDEFDLSPFRLARFSAR